MTRGGLRTLAIVAAAVCCAAAIWVAVAFRRPLVDTRTVYIGTPIVPPKPVEDFVLTGGDGRAAHVLDPHVPLEFLFFGYTHCPDECPLAMASLARAYRTLTPASRGRTRVVFVTVDPARDSPSVVRRYVTTFDPHFVGLTGTQAELARVWRSYGVTVDAKTKELGHGDAIYAIDATSHAILIYPPDTSASSLATDATALTR